MFGGILVLHFLSGISKNGASCSRLILILFDSLDGCVDWLL
jgi:hypothetical protein